METWCVPLGECFNARTSDESLWHADLLPTLGSLPDGRQTFWGLPFELAKGGPERGNLVVVGGKTGTAAVEIPVDRTATHVVFAHFYDQGPVDGTWRYGPFSAITDPGSSVGRYSLVYADGSETTVALRLRFEIAPPYVPAQQQAPFLARPHTDPMPVDFRGPFPRGAWGQMQTGVAVHQLSPTYEELAEGLAYPPGVWTLFALTNPTPAATIRAIRIEGDERGPVAVGAVTLFCGTTHPLRRERLHTVQVTQEAGETLTSVQVGVDLGVIVRVSPDNPVDVSGWLRGAVPGRGDLATSPDARHGVSVQLSASWDATLRVGGSEIPMRELYKYGSGASQDGRWRARIVDRARFWLQARVIDGQTGRPTPARVHFRSVDGRYLPPYGHRAEVNVGWFEDYGADLKLGSTQYAYVDGHFRIEVPPGPVLVEVSKGFEYTPIRTQVDIEPGQTELTLRLDRLADGRRDGWVTGDTHVHFLSPDTALLEAKAEGINVVNLLAAQWGDLYTNIGDITGRLAGCSEADTLVWVGTENRQHFLGHISLLGVQGDPVAPLSTAGPLESYIGDGTAAALADWADECRHKGGLVVAPHFPTPHSEVIADIILGKVDAVEVGYWFNQTLDDFRMHEWYRLLNCGYQVPVVGGTDKMSAVIPVGGVRTYAHIADRALDFDTWAQAVRLGHTYVTSGPLLDFEVEGRTPGDHIELTARGGTLHVKATAVSAVPIRSIEIVRNGRVVADRIAPGQGQTRLTFEEQVRVDTSGWIAARCTTGQQACHVLPTLIAAHTSPVYLTLGNWQPVDRETGRYFLTIMQGGIDWLDTLAIVESAGTNERIKQVLVDAMSRLRSRM